MPGWHEEDYEVDDVAVERAIRGTIPGWRLGFAERDIAIAFLCTRGLPTLGGLRQTLSDRQIAEYLGLNETCVFRSRKKQGFSSGYVPTGGSKYRPRISKPRTIALAVEEYLAGRYAA